MKLTGSRPKAEDLFSETWLKVAEKHRNLHPDQDPQNWIYTVCLNLYRKSYAKARREGLWVVDSETALREFQAGGDVETDAVDAEDAARLRTALEKLDDKYRVPLILFYYREESYKDIALIMKLPMSTIQYRIHQAKKILHKEMGDDC